MRQRSKQRWPREYDIATRGDEMKFWPTRRTVMRWALVLAAVVGVLFIANGVMAWRTYARRQANIDAIRAAGDPASISDLTPKAIPYDENAAAQIAALADATKVFEKDYVTFLERTELGKAYDKAEGPPNAEQTAAMRAILDKNAAIAAGISQAAACDVWASRGDFAVDHHTFLEQLLQRIQLVRSVFHYGRWEMIVLIQEGKADEAVRRGTELLKLARLFEAEPALVSYLCAIACRGAALDQLPAAVTAGRIAPETREALDEELARTDDPNSFLKALRLERAVAMDAFPTVIQGYSPAYVRLVGWPMQRHFLPAYDMMTRIIEAAEKPWRDFRHEVKHTMLGQPPGYPLADLLLPAIVASVSARDRDLTLVRSIRVLNSLELYVEQNGRQATGLTDLKMPAEATIDPYSGDPLLLNHNDGGWTVYGVGENGKDDGGTLDEKRTDVGVRTPRKVAAEAAEEKSSK